MTEKRFNARKNIDNDFEERLKVELEDIVGIVEIDDITNSVELKKEYYREQSKDKHYTYLDYSRDGHIGSFYLNDKPITNKEVCDLLNEQSEKIKELDKYCTACDDTLLTIQELTYKLLTIGFNDIEMSFIHDCIKSINKCDLLEMEKLKRE